MEDFFKDLLEDVNVNVKRTLRETTKDELLQTDFILIDIHNDIVKDLKIIDYIKLI